MEAAAVELLAEATDVIGSQSRQEPGGIKHNRYAFEELTACATPDLLFSALRRRRTVETNRQLIVG